MKLRTIVVTSAVAAVMVACSPSGSETPSPTPETPPPTTAKVITPKQSSTPAPSSTPSPSPSPTMIQSFPPPPAGETKEQAAIRDGWMNYWKVLDGYLKDPSKADLTAASLVTAQGSPKATAILDQISRYRSQNWQLHGDRHFRKVIIGVPTSEDDALRSTVSYCHDARATSVQDSSTGEAIDFDSIPTVTENALLELEDDGVWRVASIQNEAASC